MAVAPDLRHVLGPPLEDPEEEAFVVFSQTIPSQSLGFIVSKTPVIELSVAGRDLSIHQSRELLTSDRKQGTTGAVVWKVTPLFAEWIASPNFLFQAGYLSPSSTALELGAGVSGVVALTLGPKLRRYIATDQDYVIRLLKHNIAENLPAASAEARKKHPARPKRPQPAVRQGTPNIETLELDWELDSVASLPAALGQEDAESDGSHEGVDVIIACDCIYNDALIEPINSTFANICRLRSAGPNRKPTLCIIAQQLRAPDVFESWLKSFHRLFHVWQVPDELLAEPLRENTGFIVHVGYLR